MLRTLKALFEQALAPNTGAGSAPTSAERLNLSTAVLLVEVMAPMANSATVNAALLPRCCASACRLATRPPPR